MNGNANYAEAFFGQGGKRISGVGRFGEFR